MVQAVDGFDFGNGEVVVSVEVVQAGREVEWVSRERVMMRVGGDQRLTGRMIQCQSRSGGVLPGPEREEVLFSLSPGHEDATPTIYSRVFACNYGYRHHLDLRYHRAFREP